MEKEKIRQAIIIKAGIVGVVVNIMLAAVKILLGSIAGSVAIVSDAINNISDAASSVITILGSKLATKDPDEKHPYGYGRIEYITTLIISVIIIVFGIEFLKASFQAIRNPKAVNFTATAIIIMIITVLVKVMLSLYDKKAGAKAQSPSLIASGIEAMGDAVVTSITVIAGFISILFDIQVDGYAGILVSAFILYSGIKLVFDTFNDIIGKRADKKLTSKIYDEIEEFQFIKGAYDLILHNYGPNRYLGSVNVEIEDFRTIQEATEAVRPIQKMIEEKFGIFLVVGFYPVNTEDVAVIEARE
ncbi:MAG: cation diffusion facilitator family transporter, partial [Mobilitalea sp.]